MFKYLKQYKNKRGFTLIELIVVMAIVAVLVLLAAPRFWGRTNDAVMAHIQNDIRVAEDKVTELLSTEDDQFENWEVANLDDIQDWVSEDRVLGRGGLVHELDSTRLRVIPDEFIISNTGSTLSESNQFYANAEGDVFLVTPHNLISNELEKDTESDSGNVITEFEDGAYSNFLGWKAYGHEMINPGHVEFLGWSTFGHEESGVTFTGMTEEAFDGDHETFDRTFSNRVLTWKGDLEGKEIEMTLKASSQYSRTFSVLFQDDQGETIKEHFVGHANIQTTRLTVPEGTQQIVFDNHSSYSGYIYDITVNHDTDNPFGIDIIPTVSTNTVSFDWATPKQVRNYLDNERLSNNFVQASSVSTPLFPETEHSYSVEFLDEDNKLYLAHYRVQTGEARFKFEGLRAGAFDGNPDTSDRARDSTVITWEGDLAGEKIEMLVKRASGWGRTFTILFQDDDGETLKEKGVGGTSTYAIHLKVPDGATQIAFENSHESYPGFVHDISVYHNIEQPEKVSITPDVKTNNATFDWGEPKEVFTYLDGVRTTSHSSERTSVFVSLYSNQKYSYKIEFIDDVGKLLSAYFDIQSGDDGVRFKGLNARAFDGNHVTSDRAEDTSSITWDGDLSGREIDVTANTAYSFGSTAFSLIFEDKDGNELSHERFTSRDVQTVRLTVPDGATRVTFDNNNTSLPGYIYDFSLVD